MLANLLYSCFKLFLAFLISFVVYQIYFMVIKPYLWRKKYQKYPNVLTGDRFLPVVGDSIKELTCMKQNKVHYAHYEENAQITKKYDLMAKLEGSVPLMIILSNKAMGEFLQLQKRSLVDRYDTERGLQIILGKSITPRKSTPQVIQRRRNMTKWLGLNSASHFIPRMVHLCKTTLEAMEKESQNVDIMHYSNALTFNVLTRILFGEQDEGMIDKKYPFLKSDGSFEDVDLKEIFLRLAKAYMEQHFSPLTNMIPLLSKYRFIDPYKRDYKNLQTFEKAIRELVSTSKDPTAVGSKFFANKDCTDDEKVGDIILVMVGGSETTAHSVVSALYLLQKYPETLQKLRDELNANGLGKGEDFLKNCTLENLQNCTYLNCVVKESMRKDNAASTTFEYEAMQNIQICGVPIPKGQGLKIDIMSSKFDDDKWLNPHDFVPERHDPDSDFYKEAKKQGKIADVYSTRSFSLGNRNCPGQSLANLEMKVFMSYFASHMNWEFSKEDLDHEGIGFGMATEFEPKIKVSSR